MASVTLRDLLEAGVHFGHQTRRWNPKMRPYIFTERNGIYIIDLQRTMREIQAAYEFARDVAARGGHVMFVGTKKQAQEPVENEARRSSMPFVNQRWLGGMLTNWTTMKTRIARLELLERMREDGSYEALPKKEVLKLEAEREKLDRNLSGIRHMDGLPEAVFVVDTRREMIPISEARKLGITLIGLVDTNCDPDEVDYVIPGNDDAIRSVNLMCRLLADACIEGRLAAGLPVGETVVEPEPSAPSGPKVISAADLAAQTEAADAAADDAIPAAEDAVQDAPAAEEPAPEAVTDTEPAAEEGEDAVAASEPFEEPAEEIAADVPDTVEATADESQDEE